MKPIFSGLSGPALIVTSILLLTVPFPARAEEVPQDYTRVERNRIDGIELPEGFTIEFFAKVPGARSIAAGTRGFFFVGTRDDRVYAVLDEDGDGTAERVRSILTGLTMPNGVAYREGDLYVAEVGRIIVIREVARKLAGTSGDLAYEVITEAYPNRTAHGWKFIAFGPDGLLYVPVGAPCNACDPEEEIFASITRIDVEDPEIEIIARGVRNTVGFDWHPETGELWFTDNGRDWLGDNKPPDELNRLSEPGEHFGFPYVHGNSVIDPEFGGSVTNLDRFTRPELELGPHVAALGMRFYTGSMFPPRYRGRIFIAEHGSWNRSEKIGYRVTLAEMEGSEATDYTVFASGWLDETTGRAWGRPVDVQILNDGSLLISDDAGGYLYRVTYRETE